MAICTFAITQEAVEQSGGDKMTWIPVSNSSAHCNFTCHYPCPIRENDEKYRCKAMDSGGKESAQCTVCPGNCPWSQHVNASQRFELYYVVETHTFDGLKKNLGDTDLSL